MPISPEPNSHTAAGTGTALTEQSPEPAIFAEPGVRQPNLKSASLELLSTPLTMREMLTISVLLSLILSAVPSVKGDNIPSYDKESSRLLFW